MSSSAEESPKRLPMVPDSVDDEIYDFLYVDRARVSALYAQLFPEGTLTSVKTSHQQGSTDDQNIGSDLRFFKAEKKSGTTGSEGIEHVFDASWAVPVEVLAALNKRAIVHRTFSESVQLGVIALMHAHLRIIDYVTMRGLWGPTYNVAAATGQELPGAREFLELVDSLPHAIHAHFLTNYGLLWSSLEPSNLSVPPADIVLKHGGYMSSGLWRVLFLLDAFPDPDTAPAALQSWGAGSAGDGVLTAMRGLRGQIGRPPNWFGITPLMIYRAVPSLAGQGSLNLAPSGGT